MEGFDRRRHPAGVLAAPGAGPRRLARSILKHTTRSHYTFIGSAGQTYRFRVRAVNTAGQAGKWSPSTLSGTATPH